MKKQEIAQTAGSEASPASIGAEPLPALFHSGTSARGPICIQPTASPSSNASRPGGGPASMRALM